MELDIRTLLFVSGLVLFIQALTFSYLSSSNTQYAGIREWTIGVLAMSVGFIALFLRQYESFHMASVFISNFLLVCGLIILYHGSGIFLGVNIQRKWLWLFMGIYLLLIFIFTYIDYQLTVRIILFSLTSSVLFFLTGWNFLKHNQPSYRKPAFFLAIILFIHTFFFIIRMLYHIKFRELDSIFSNNFIQNITFLFPVSMGILWTFVLVIIINQRLNGEVREQASELEKMNAEKERIFSIIAHDLRGPFASILSLSNVIADKTFKLSPDQYAEMAASIEKTAHSANTLLENLLEWSGIRRGVRPFYPQKHVFGSIMHATLENLHDNARLKNIQLVNNIDDNLIIYTDLNMFQTLFRNLVSNAIKFTVAGGSIVLDAGTQSDGSTLFSVKDNGIGMSETMLTSLFEFRFNNNRPGTNDEPSSGLGLQLCQEIVKVHQGKLWVVSKEQQGSTFFFQLNISE
jgi:signal transduction histidine kinase